MRLRSISFWQNICEWDKACPKKRLMDDNPVVVFFSSDWVKDVYIYIFIFVNKQAIINSVVVLLTKFACMPWYPSGRTSVGTYVARGIFWASDVFC